MCSPLVCCRVLRGRFLTRGVCETRWWELCVRCAVLCAFVACVFFFCARCNVKCNSKKYLRFAFRGYFSIFSIFFFILLYRSLCVAAVVVCVCFFAHPVRLVVEALICFSFDPCFDSFSNTRTYYYFGFWSLLFSKFAFSLSLSLSVLCAVCAALCVVCCVVCWCVRGVKIANVCRYMARFRAEPCKCAPHYASTALAIWNRSHFR